MKISRDGELPKRNHTQQEQPQEPILAVALLTERQQAKVEMMTAEVQSITSAATLRPLTCVEDAANLTELVARAKVAFKELEMCRRSAVDPLGDRVKKINDLFRPLTWALCDLEDKAKRHLLAWNQRERARVAQEKEATRLRQEEAARAETAAMNELQDATTVLERLMALEKAKTAADEQMIAAVEAPREAPRGIRTDSGSAGVKERWTFQVLDQAQVPREYLAVDERLIRKAVNVGERNIPGVAIYLEEGIAVRTG